VTATTKPSTVEISHPEKVFWPDEGYTKQDLADFYQELFPPNSGQFADAARAGQYLKEALDALKLLSFPKTSGSRGLHVFVPVRVGPTADEVLKFSQEVVARVASSHPKELTVEHSIAARGRRVYLDAFRNGSVQTVVAPPRTRYAASRMLPFQLRLIGPRLSLRSTRADLIWEIFGSGSGRAIRGRNFSTVVRR
jgi:bifunctional non-homologous end joining protein LigD